MTGQRGNIMSFNSSRLSTRPGRLELRPGQSTKIHINEIQRQSCGYRYLMYDHTPLRVGDRFAMVEFFDTGLPVRDTGQGKKMAGFCSSGWILCWVHHLVCSNADPSW